MGPEGGVFGQAGGPRESLAGFFTSRQQVQHVAAADDNLAQSDRAVSTDLIALYKSLGGGWPVAGAAPSDHPQA